MQSLLPIFSIFILLSLPLMTMANENGNNNINLSISQITNEKELHCGKIDIFGDSIIWDNTTNQNDVNIEGYNIKEKNKFVVTSDYGNQQNPTIYGKRIIWEDIYRNEISGYDLEKKIKVTYIVGKGPCPGEQCIALASPTLFEDKLVGISHPTDTSNTSIILYNLTTFEKKIIRLCKNLYCGITDIWGNYIVYYDNLNDQGITYGYNLLTNEEFIIANDTNITLGNFQGDYLIYHKKDREKDAFFKNYYLYNISSRRIDRNLPDFKWDLIWGDFIIASYFHIYQISTNTTFNYSNQFSCYSVYENNIACLESNRGSSNIVLVKIVINNQIDGNNTDDGKGHNSLTIPSATMSFLVMAIIIIAVVRRRRD